MPTIPAGSVPVEFGVSGLIYQSNLILFDRRAEAKGESPVLPWSPAPMRLGLTRSHLLELRYGNG